MVDTSMVVEHWERNSNLPSFVDKEQVVVVPKRPGGRLQTASTLLA
jgi:hypothetical protein